MLMPPRICPRCFEARAYNERCKTSACQPFLSDLKYLRDALEGNLFIAREQLKAGDARFDWPTIIRELEEEMQTFDAKMGPRAFRQ